MNRFPKPGDLTAAFACGPIDCYEELPVDGVLSGVPRSRDIDQNDGMLFVVAHVEEWLFVLSSTGRLGWVCRHDVGSRYLSGTVFNIA